MRFRVTVEAPDESLSFLTGNLDAAAARAVVGAALRLLEHRPVGWALRFERIPDEPGSREGSNGAPSLT